MGVDEKPEDSMSDPRMIKQIQLSALLGFVIYYVLQIIILAYVFCIIYLTAPADSDDTSYTFNNVTFHKRDHYDKIMNEAMRNTHLTYWSNHKH